jgi:hypothetical protein
MKTVVAAAVLAVATASGANAANVLFSQDFNSLPQALGLTSVPGFTVTGTVDVVTSGNFSINCVGNTGACLDIDGTPGPGSMTSVPIAFAAGQRVTVSFDLSGNQRGDADDIFLFNTTFGAPTDLVNFQCVSTFSCPGGNLFGITNLGGYGESLTPFRAWQSYAFAFTPGQSGTLQLYFGSPSADNIGPVLDNVLVSQVPEPASWAMLIAGFGLVGAAARRRRTVVAA